MNNKRYFLASLLILFAVSACATHRTDTINDSNNNEGVSNSNSTTSFFDISSSTSINTYTSQNMSSSNSSSTESSSSEHLHEHTFSNAWSYDDSYHWHESTCGHDVIDAKAAHTYVATNTIGPTYDHGGYTTYTCTICGHTKNDDETSKLEYMFSEEWYVDEEKGCYLNDKWLSIKNILEVLERGL